jgi:hypothetical protein
MQLQQQQHQQYHLVFQQQHQEQSGINMPSNNINNNNSLLQQQNSKNLDLLYNSDNIEDDLLPCDEEESIGSTSIMQIGTQETIKGNNNRGENRNGNN